MAQKEFDDARADAGYTQSSGYREVDSYTTADGTRYIAKASNKRTQIIKVDPSGETTYLAIHSKKGSRDSNANRVAGEFSAFKEGLEAAEAGQNITYTEALLIGLFQVLAFIPGASRAGVTITAARFLGYDRLNAARFSMLLSIPIILASMTLSLINVFNEEKVAVNFYHSFSAALVAFIAALLSIIFLMRFIKKANFNIFIIYRIILGIILLIVYV